MKTAIVSFALIFAATTCAVHAAGPAKNPTTAPAYGFGPDSPEVRKLKKAPIELAIHPAAVPEPALKYRLVPGYAEQTPGDAAQIYLTAMLLLNIPAPEADRIGEMFSAPNDKFSIAAATEILESHRAPMEMIEIAARRTHCDFETLLREKGFYTLLPHLSHCRHMAQLLALKARVQTSQGQFDEAIRTLQTGFGMVVHLKNEATLIQGLVSLAIIDLLLDRVEQLEQTPGAPNLYWALADLPRPLVDLHAMGDIERSSVGFMFPSLKGRSLDNITDEDIKGMQQLLQQMSVITRSDSHSGVAEKLNSIFDAARALGPAKKWLLSHGYSEEKVNAMQPGHVVWIYFLESYAVQSDETYKWIELPYWQQGAALDKAEDQLKRLRAENDPNWLLQLLPAVKKVSRQVAQMDRRLTMLQTVEGLRAYAATHEGKLPAALSDLTDTPAPMDPMTGKSFEYEAAGTTATLRSTGRAGHEEETQVFHVVISAVK